MENKTSSTSPLFTPPNPPFYEIRNFFAYYTLPFFQSTRERNQFFRTKNLRFFWHTSIPKIQTRVSTWAKKKSSKLIYL